jgi:hypothetical protein
VDSLKVLDLKWPIREADMATSPRDVRSSPESGHSLAQSNCPLSADGVDKVSY